MLFFLDIETTGLDETKDEILEIACLAVNDALDVVGSRSLVVKPPGDWINLMDPFVRKMHRQNGLISSVRNAGIPCAKAVQSVMDLLMKAGAPVLTLCGNSIHFDRRFLRAQMPAIEQMFHHRMLDVSSIRIMVERNWSGIIPSRTVEPAHRAYDDALESLQMYKHYVKHLNSKKWAKVR